jgi:hypothetical protein
MMVANSIAQSQILNRTSVSEIQGVSRKQRPFTINKPRIINLPHHPSNDYKEQESGGQPSPARGFHFLFFLMSFAICTRMAFSVRFKRWHLQNCRTEALLDRANSIRQNYVYASQTNTCPHIL